MLQQLPDGALVQPAVFDGQLPGQGHLSEPLPLLCALLIAGIPVLHPCDHDPAAIRRQQGLGGVEVNAVVDGLTVFIGKMLFTLVRMADEAQGAVTVAEFEALRQHILGAAQQHLLAVQHKIVGALPHQAEALVVFDQDALKFPMQGILTAILHDDAASVFPAGAHHTAVGTVGIPPDLGITEIVAAQAFRQFCYIDDGVSFVFVIIQAITNGNALGLHFLTQVATLFTDAGVHQQLLSVGQLHCRAGEHAEGVIGLVRCHGAGQILPVKQIRADHMAPMHGVPNRIIGIALIEQMVLSLVVGEAVGVIGPANLRGHVENGAGIGADFRACFLFICSCKQ